MKTLITYLALFILLTIFFSSLTGCGSSANVANQANANKPGNQNAASTETKVSAYPMVPNALAEAEIELLDGTKTKISDHRGKLLLVNLWGIWCGPCVAEMPQLSEFQQTYGDRGLEVYGLNIGDQELNPESIEKITAFVKKLNVNYTIARTPGSTAKQFYLISKQEVVPQTILVDREGHLRGVFTGGGPRIIKLMSDTIEKALAE